MFLKDLHLDHQVIAKSDLLMMLLTVKREFPTWFKNKKNWPSPSPIALVSVELETRSTILLIAFGWYA